MFSSIPLAALLLMQGPAGDPGDSAIAPVIGEEVAAVLHIRPSSLDAEAIAPLLGGILRDERAASGAAKLYGDWAGALKKAGASDVYVLIDLAELTSLPVAAVPLGAGANAEEIARILKGGGMEYRIRWDAAEEVRGVMIAGSPAAIARIRAAGPARRADLIAALGAAKDAPIVFAIAPSDVQRRAINEAVAVLPQQVGGAPIEAITGGLRWISLSMATEPKASLLAILQAKDPASAETLRATVRGAIGLLAEKGGAEPAVAELIKAIGPVEPRVQGDRVELEANLTDAVALMSLPAQRARASALRSQCTNNLKQIALALHNYHAAHNHFPAAFGVDKDGKPLLSWRVHILPFLDQKELYDQFHQDEPWDSPHNKALIARMPAVYACPSGDPALAAEGKTGYLTPRGPATIFPGVEAVKIRDITDGMSNTILVVDAADKLAVPWTKPDDWTVPAEPDFKALVGHHLRGTNVSFGDGSVRFIRDMVKPATLRALTTRNGGEPINPEEF